jgi:hypothetical protein
MPQESVLKKEPVKPNLRSFSERTGRFAAQKPSLYHGVKQGCLKMMLFKPPHLGLSPNKKSTKTGWNGYSTQAKTENGHEKAERDCLKDVSATNV